MYNIFPISNKLICFAFYVSAVLIVITDIPSNNEIVDRNSRLILKSLYLLTINNRCMEFVMKSLGSETVLVW